MRNVEKENVKVQNVIKTQNSSQNVTNTREGKKSQKKAIKICCSHNSK